MGLGIILYFQMPQELPFWISLVLTGGIACFLWALRNSLNPFWSRLCLWVTLSLCIGFTAAQMRTLWVGTVMIPHEIFVSGLEGTLLEIEQIPHRFRITLQDLTCDSDACEEEGESEKESLNNTLKKLSSVRITLRGKLGEAVASLQPGDRVRLNAVLMPPQGPLAPGAYDFRRKAYFSKISAVGFGTSMPRWKDPLKMSDRLEGCKKNKESLSILGLFWLKLASLRQSLTSLLRQRLGGIEGEIAASLVTGDRSGIPSDVRQAFSDSGLAHILAISGLHLSLASGLAFGLIRRGLGLSPFLLLRYPVKKISAAGALLFSMGYLLISGVSLPAQRACLMTSFVLLGVMLDRTPLTLRSVALSATAILLILPESLLSPSFQMSFAAVISLIAGYGIMQPYLGKSQEGQKSFLSVKRLFLYLLGIVVSTLLATLATTPYII